MQNGKPEYSYELYIAASPAEVWKGITDGELTRQYVYGTRLQSSLKPGAPYAYVGDGDMKVVDGKILDVEPERRLVMSWAAHWDEAVNKDRASRVTYRLTPIDPMTTKLTLVHDDFDGETATYKGSVGGWPLMLSALKSLLETGKPLAVR